MESTRLFLPFTVFRIMGGIAGAVIVRAVLLHALDAYVAPWLSPALLRQAYTRYMVAAAVFLCVAAAAIFLALMERGPSRMRLATRISMALFLLFTVVYSLFSFDNLVGLPVYLLLTGICLNGCLCLPGIPCKLLGLSEKQAAGGAAEALT